MSRPGLNAAREPFYNTRPVRRIVSALWAGGAILLLVNAWLYWRAWTGQNDRQEELAQLESGISAKTEREKAIQSAIAGIEIDALNEQIYYLNGKLAERTFGWSELFDRLSDVLPNEVRLSQLNPQFAGGADEVFTGDSVLLLLMGTAKQDEALLEFIDALFKHSSFRRPSLQTEAKNDAGEIRWVLNAVYFPRFGSDSETEEPGETDEPADVSEPAESAAIETGSAREEAAVSGESVPSGEESSS